MIQLTAKLGGISVVQMTDDLVELAVLDSANKQHTLRILCRNLTGDAEILPGSTLDGSEEVRRHVCGGAMTCW